MDLTLIRRQLFTYLPAPTESYSGKTIIVTGSNVGLGKEAAKHYARLGAETVIIAVRSPSRERRGRKNAGIGTATFRLVEGYESTITVNVISTFLLLFLCLLKLKDTGQRHNIRPTVTIILEALSDPSRAKMATRYPTSKLLEIFCVRAFAESHPADKYPVTVNGVCPGFCHSELAREFRGGWKLYIIKLLLARSTELVSRGLLYATQYGPESHGRWVYDNTIHAPGEFVTTPEGQKVEKRFWNELLERLEEISPGVMQN
ncbi:NAD(P)-binding protein [Athelia psychrophila]|uniref:NAD(P)-binding protein n=1 Tax=Athelia psychrophila TaxID=1759441 RepID=A0A166GWS1_9AGAM|nr:NAD(P)-binding protein [Fibularhizoctonia sp. CBS 109695]